MYGLMDGDTTFATAEFAISSHITLKGAGSAAVPMPNEALKNFMKGTQMTEPVTTPMKAMVVNPLVSTPQNSDCLSSPNISAKVNFIATTKPSSMSRGTMLSNARPTMSNITKDEMPTPMPISALPLVSTTMKSTAMGMLARKTQAGTPGNMDNSRAAKAIIIMSPMCLDVMIFCGAPPSGASDRFSFGLLKVAARVGFRTKYIVMTAVVTIMEIEVENIHGFRRCAVYSVPGFSRNIKTSSDARAPAAI